jgi:hypothetical protein
MHHPADQDWFGHPIGDDGRRPVEPVPCPFCGTTFTRSAELAAHTRGVHHVDHDPGRIPAVFTRLATWSRGLKFLPLWFVLPMNAGVTLVLFLAFGQDLALFSTGDQTGVFKTWILRLSILPSVLLLSWRVIDRRV